MTRIRFSSKSLPRNGAGRRVVLLLLVVAFVLGAIHVALAASSDPPSTYVGTRLTIAQAIQAAYAAGFHNADQLVTVVGIGEAESSLTTGTRNWHPEYGFRPASDAIGVAGPADVWNANHTQQMQSDRGVWQISSRWWPQYTDAQTDNPAQAAAIVYSISKQGTDFTPWDTFKNGAAQQFAGSIRPLVNQFLGSPTTTPPVASKPASAPTVKPTPTTVKSTPTTVKSATTVKPTTVKPTTVKRRRRR